MEVIKLSLQGLFDMRVRYEIPQYQRRYVWTQEEQWEPLWDDIRNTTERCLEDSGYKTAHFLGAVVIQQKAHRMGSLQTPEVVDGQQRLTTMQLLLDAVQEVFEKRGHTDSATRLQDMVLNGEAYRGGDPDRAFKVWPTMGDRDAFRKTMRNESSNDEYQKSLIVQAHEFFKLQVGYWLDSHAEEKEEVRAATLELVLTQLLQLIVIDLVADEEPHVIFETLNARGTPLLQSELIKNMLLHEAGRTGSIDTSELWNLDEDWWRKEQRQGRLVRPRSDIFLNYWLVMRTQKEVAHNNVFRDFRIYGDFGNSESNEKAVNEAKSIAHDLRSVGEEYARIVERRIPEIETFLYRLDIMQVGVLTPVLMWLVSSDANPEGTLSEQVKRGTRALESYLVRRMVCRMTTKDYNRLFLSLIGELQKNGPENSGDTILEYLRGQDAESRVWPGDGEVEHAFISSPLYRLLTRGRLRIVLEGIEGELQTNLASIQSVPRTLTMEHIVPQSWGENWDLPSDIEDQTQARIDRNRIIHTIGNLTLVNQPLNSTMSNYGWDEKSKILRKHFNLFLNKEVVDEPEWDEDKIRERSHHLAQVAMKVWPHADGI